MNQILFKWMLTQHQKNSLNKKVNLKSLFPINAISCFNYTKVNQNSFKRKIKKNHSKNLIWIEFHLTEFMQKITYKPEL